MGTRLNRLGEAVLTCTHNLCLSKNKKKKMKQIRNSTENVRFFFKFKDLCTLHGHVFIMDSSKT